MLLHLPVWTVTEKYLLLYFYIAVLFGCSFEVMVLFINISTVTYKLLNACSKNVYRPY
jgi:hypothetical protein